MIAFGSAITRPDVYERCARAGIERVAEPDAVVIDLPAPGSIFESYNAVLDRARGLPDLEALVLLHQDAEIVSEDFCERVREVLSDPQVGVAGCAGAIGVRSIAWWEGSVTCASFVHRYDEHGGGEIEAATWSWPDAPPYAHLGEVDTLDGFLLVLSPWAARKLRFDESLGAFHGYDLDFCMQVRAAGRKVVTADFRAIHHHALAPFADAEEWIEAHMRLADKWEGRPGGFEPHPGDWRERALQAEAETAAARGNHRTSGLEAEARIRQLERELTVTKGSLSWRLAAPLRAGARTR
jgi:hypothetical protein